MFRIYLADDNKLTRESLKCSVPWKELGYDIVGEADSGLQALEDIRRLEPDAALLDIRMPGMSGIDVADRIKEDGIKCICIMVSGYSDFTYAQQGIKAGVFDYLLKPVQNQELIQVLERAKDVIERNGPVQKEKVDQMEHRRKLFCDCIHGYEKAAYELDEMLCGEWSYTCYEVCMIKPVCKRGMSLSGEEVERFINCERELLELYRCRTQIRTIDFWMDDGLVVLLLFPRVWMMREYDLAALRLANMLLERSSEAGEEVCISISNARRELTMMQEAWKEAVFAYDSRFFLENKNMIHYGSIKSKSVANEYSLMQRVEDFYAVLRERPEEMENSLESIFELIRNGQNYEVEYVKNIFMNMALMLKIIMSDDDKRQSEVKTAASIMKEIGEINSMSDAFSWLAGYARCLTEQSREAEGQAYSGTVRKILDYLNLHYTEKISLQDVADYMGLSNGHICRILKNETGETFITLMNKIRIQAAIRLLKESNKKVYEIAEEVGFSNYAYFYQLFKKETGYPPKNYQC